MKTDLFPQQPTNTLDYAPDPRAAEALPPPAPPPPATWLRVVVILVLVTAILGGAAAVTRALINTRPLAGQSPVKIPPTLVESRMIEAREVREILTGYGTARAETAVDLSAEVTGQIVDMPRSIQDGATVAAADVIARIDERTYRNQLERATSMLADIDAKSATLEVEHQNLGRLIEIAERELAVNQAEYERLLDLYERKSASKKEVDFARLAAERSRREVQTMRNQRDLIPAQRAELAAQRGMREAEIGMARLDVERCTIHAPIAGQLELVSVETGNQVMTGMRIARIVDTQLIEVPIELPLSAWPKVRVGAEAVLTAEATVGVEWQATVARLSPVANEASRTFLAYLMVDNREQAVPLVPGSFVTAKIEGDLLQDALVIPRGVIVEGHVFVAIEGGIAERRRVRVTTLIGDEAVVTGEIASGDRLITSNLDVLHTGAAVRIAADETADGDGA